MPNPEATGLKATYRCLHRQVFVLGAYAIGPLQAEHMELIRVWRNEQLDILRQSKLLSMDDQQRYYQNAVQPLYDQPEPPMILVSYFYQDELIGYGGLTNIDWEAQRAELSVLLATQRTHSIPKYQTEFGIFLKLLKQLAFKELNINRIFSETYDIRPHIVAILEQEGFRPEGRMKQHVKIQGQYVDALIHGCLREHYQ